MSDIKIENPKIKEIIAALAPALHGKDEVLTRLLACIFAGGHVLLEDLPGLGKTTLALAVARVLGLQFGRVQCTNDLLPTDVTGLNIFKADKGAFEFHPGPVFNNLVLVDEINRATPKTQSALLEAMGEGQATVDGKTYRLPQPFFVIATQNPVEHAGTFPLPESQMDRFMARLSLGYPVREAERDILRAGSQREELENLPALLNAQEIVAAQAAIERDITVSDKIIDYILTVAEQTRAHPDVAVGISTRGAMVLLRAARAAAWMQGRDYVIPEDVKAFADEVLLHRLILKQGSERAKKELLTQLFAQTQAV